ncbi:Rnf-Nqr domain containing protein [Helcococcus sueciensis]|uniref:Rnf-Nqr domain containing protein n=1 Tax=Helcococcus sueciensis TaxID=241555 RepID=UPI00041B5DFB|nr:Rnf-Nqr domain containing protein [Helcococcus sueciensis]
MAKYTKIIKDQLLYDNPVLLQVIGICSALAVTNNASNSLVMGLALIFTTGLSSFVTSVLKDITPNHIRMVMQVFVISFFVIIVDLFLKAYMPEMSETLGPYVGLIITNCIIMGRAEGFAMSNPPLASLIDGAAAGAGYTLVLLAVAIIRELLGFGTVFGIRLLPETFTSWSLMIMPPGAFFILPIIMWIMYNYIHKNEKKGGK